MTKIITDKKLMPKKIIVGKDFTGKIKVNEDPLSNPESATKKNGCFLTIFKLLK